MNLFSIVIKMKSAPLFIVLMIIITNIKSKLRLFSKINYTSDESEDSDDNESLEEIDLIANKENNNPIKINNNNDDEDNNVNNNSIKNLKIMDRRPSHYKYQNALENFRSLIASKEDANDQCDKIGKNIFNSIYENENKYDRRFTFNNFNTSLNSNYENFLLSLKQQELIRKLKTTGNIESSIFYINYKNVIKGNSNNGINFNKLFNNAAIEDNLYVFSKKSNSDLSSDDLIFKFSFVERKNTNNNNKLANYLKLSLSDQEVYFALDSLYFQLNSVPFLSKSFNGVEVSRYAAQISLILKGIDKNGSQNNKNNLVLNIYLSQNNNYNDKDSKNSVNNEDKNILQEANKLDLDIEFLKILKDDIKNILNLNGTENNISLGLIKSNNSNEIDNLNKKALNLKKLLLNRFNYTENLGDNLIDSMQYVIDSINKKQNDIKSSNDEAEKEKNIGSTMKIGLDFSFLSSILENPNSNFELSSIKAVSENGKDCELFYQMDLIDNIPLSAKNIKTLKSYLNELIKNKSAENQKFFDSNVKLIQKSFKVLTENAHKTNSFLKEKENAVPIKEESKTIIENNQLIKLLTENKIKKSKVNLNQNETNNFSPLNFHSFSKPVREVYKKFEDEILNLEDSFSYLLSSNKIITTQSKNIDMVKMLDNFLLLITNNSNKVTKNIVHRDVYEEDLEELNEEEEGDIKENENEINFRDDPADANNNDSDDVPRPKKKKHKKKHKKNKHLATSNETSSNQTANISADVIKLPDSKPVQDDKKDNKINDETSDKNKKENQKIDDTKKDNEKKENKIKENVKNVKDNKENIINDNNKDDPNNLKNDNDKKNKEQTVANENEVAKSDNKHDSDNTPKLKEHNEKTENKSEDDATKVKKKKHKKKHKKHHKNHTHPIKNTTEANSNSTKNIKEKGSEIIKESPASIAKSSVPVINENPSKNNSKNQDNNKLLEEGKLKAKAEEKINFTSLLNYLDSIKIVPVVVTQKKPRMESQKNNTSKISSVPESTHKEKNNTSKNSSVPESTYKENNNTSKSSSVPESTHKEINNTSKSSSVPESTYKENNNTSKNSSVPESIQKEIRGNQTKIETAAKSVVNKTIVKNDTVKANTNKTIISVNNKTEIHKNESIIEKKEIKNTTNHSLPNSNSNSSISLNNKTKPIEIKQATKLTNISNNFMVNKTIEAEKKETTNKSVANFSNESISENDEQLNSDDLSNSLDDVDETELNQTISKIISLTANKSMDHDIKNVVHLNNLTANSNLKAEENSSVKEQKPIEIHQENTPQNNHININVHIIRTKTKKTETENQESIKKEDHKPVVTIEPVQEEKNETVKLEKDSLLKNKDVFYKIEEKGNATLSRSIPRISRKQNLKINGNDVIFDETIIFGDTSS